MAESILAPGFKPTPYWWEAMAPAPTPEEEPPLPQAADVAIIGAGFTGVSAALTLARAGRRVVALDALPPGRGASSRNAGLVTKFLHTGLERYARKIGRERLTRYLRETGDAFDYLTGLIEGEQIECHFVRCGRFVSAPTGARLESLVAELGLLRALAGTEGEVLRGDELRREIGTDYFRGGIVLEGTGALHPGLYIDGLAERARNAGAHIAGHAAVTAIVWDGEGFALKTTRGQVRARDVVLATNGYTGPLTPHFRRRIVPVQASMMATERIDPALLKRVMPSGRTYVDNARVWRYWRAAPDDSRFMFGALPGYKISDPRRLAAAQHREMTAVFPELATTRISHCWSGRVALSFDHMPHLGVHEGVHYALAMNGTGVPLGTWLGHKIALRLLGEKDAATAYDDLPFETRPTYGGKPWFLPALVRGNRALDRLGL
jgi:glycine/D-amino acid oxidase-like deaminating enzyme